MDSDHEIYEPEGPAPNHRSLLDLDRDRGILTPADRRVLVGEAEFKPGSNSERKARQRIRERIRNSVLDYYLLLNYLEDRDLAQAFGQDEPERVVYDDVISVINGAVGFFYAASTIHPDDDEKIFETRVQQGITAAEVTRNGVAADVSVSIKVNREESLETLASRVREEGAEADITPNQMNTLFSAGKIDRDLYARVMEDLLQ